MTSLSATTQKSGSLRIQQKRKKIKSALREYIDEDLAEKLSLNLDLRPQELTPEDYLAIAESIQ